MTPENIDIVLVEPLYAGNIGGVARAMKNMGLTRLTLVNPKQFPSREADYRAVSAVDVLENARVVDSLQQAISASQFVVGTSGRSQRIPWPTQDPRRCAERISRHSAWERVAIVFGREDRGLANDEMQLCNLLCHIPTHEGYTSVNLAMAVQIITWELRMQVLESTRQTPEPSLEDSNWDAPFADMAEMERFYAHLEETLVAIDFLKPEAPRQLMARLRRLYGRVRLDTMEVNILRGILTETQNSIAGGRRR